MCSKWLTFRTKKLSFWIKQKLITVIKFFLKNNNNTKKKKNMDPTIHKILYLSFYLILLWMCSKWLNFRIKNLHFRIKQKMVTAIHKIWKKELLTYIVLWALGLTRLLVLHTFLYYTFTYIAHICLLYKGTHVYPIILRNTIHLFSISNMISKPPL